VLRVNAGMYAAINSFPAYRASYAVKAPPTPTEQLQEFKDLYRGRFQYMDMGDRFDRLIEESKGWSVK
jgi:hypothetical protein